MARKATVKRKTSETDITLSLELDGKGNADVKTGIPFFDHMLTLFAKHGLFDLKLRAKGDIEVDFHHTVEDVGITLGLAVKRTLKTKAGINRYGSADVPMMDALASVVLDLSDRPYLKYKVKLPSARAKMAREVFDPALVEEFMKAFSNSAGVDLHIRLDYGRDVHHSIEAIYKALGRALSVAVTKNLRVKGIPSTKGKL